MRGRRGPMERSKARVSDRSPPGSAVDAVSGWICFTRRRGLPRHAVV